MSAGRVPCCLFISGAIRAPRVKSVPIGGGCVSTTRRRYVGSGSSCGSVPIAHAAPLTIGETQLTASTAVGSQTRSLRLGIAPDGTSISQRWTAAEVRHEGCLALRVQEQVFGSRWRDMQGLVPRGLPISARPRKRCFLLRIDQSCSFLMISMPNPASPVK